MLINPDQLASLSQMDPALLMASFMPTGAQATKCMEHVDGAIKLEILLMSFHATMKTAAFAEFVICVMMIGFFLRSPGTMAFYFFHLLHIVRAMLTIGICNKVPYPKSIVQKLKADAEKQTQTNYTFEEYEVYIESLLTE